MKELTPKQAHFAEEYLKDLNGKQAAIRVGVAERNAEVQASKWLSNPKVASYVEQLRADRSQKTNIDAAWLLNRLSQEATADISDLYDDEGGLLPVKQWPLIWRQGLVQGIEVEELYEGAGRDRVSIGKVRKVKLDNRVKRLELIGRHIGVKAFEDTINVKGLDQLADRLARAAQRDAKDV